MATDARERLIVLARSPRAGSVKTRLIPLLGADGATELHVRLLERSLEIARSYASAELELHATDVSDETIRNAAANSGAVLLPQIGDGLGERMRSAFERALSHDRCSAVVLIGTDCAVLSERYVAQAFDALRAGCDAVLGPAEDGGYVLIGLTRVAPELFSGVSWGTDAVLAETRERLRTLGWVWRELDTLWDIDRPDDYARYAALGTRADG